MNRAVRRRLIEVAKSGRTITYGELMGEFGIPRGHPRPGIGIGHVVGEISEHEDASKPRRPLLSAIVVRADSATRLCPHGHPGGGIFGIDTPRIPQELRREAADQNDERYSPEDAQFIVREQQKVWNYWRDHEDPERDL